MIIGVLCFAVFVQLGRAAFPYLDDYHQVLAKRLSNSIGSHIEFGGVEAEWSGLRPHLVLNNVLLASSQGEKILTVDQVQVEVSLLASLKDWRFAWRKLSFDGLVTTLQQNAQGRWAVKGLESSSASTSNNFQIDDPLDIFLFGRRIELTHTLLRFELRTGHKTAVEFPDITLENDADFHRLSARFSVDEDLRALSLVVEGHGDPRDTESFNAMGYLELNQFPAEKVVAAVAQDIWDELDEGKWREEGRVDLQLWFEGTMDKGVDFRGHVGSGLLPFKLPEAMHLPLSTKAQFVGHWTAEKGIELGVKDVRMQWESFESPPLNVIVRSSIQTPFSVLLDRVDIEEWLDVAKNTGLLDNEKLRRVIKTLSPAGVLTCAEVSVSGDSESPFVLRSHVQDISVQSMRGSPTLTQVNGYVEATPSSGRVILDSRSGFSMHYPTVYQKPLDYDVAKGEVRWLVDHKNSTVLVSSGRLHLEGEDGEGNGHLFLSLPFKKKKGVEPEMTLVVGLKKSVAKYHEKYVPFTIPDSLYDWINRSIGQGNLSNGGFIYRGSLRAKPLRPRSIQLSMDIEDADVTFDPHWPTLQRAKAHLLLDDLDLSIWVDEADLLANNIRDAHITLEDIDGHKAAAIAIKGSMFGDSRHVFALLENSPVKKIVGDALEQIDLSGDVSGSVDLLVPLKKNLGAGYQSIDVDLSDNRLALPSIHLEFEQVNGNLLYDTQKGLHTENIEGRLWGETINAAIETRTQGKTPATLIHFDGPLDMLNLAKWTKRKELLFAEGKSRVDGLVTIPRTQASKSIMVSFKSDLIGTSIQLPKPYQKLAKTALALSGEVEVGRSRSKRTEKYRFDLGELARLRIRKIGNVVGVNVGLGEDAEPTDHVVSVIGRAPHADVLEWVDIVNQYMGTPSLSYDATKNDAETSRREEELLADISISIDALNLGELETHNVDLNVASTGHDWRFDFKNEELSGSYNIVTDEDADQANRLHLRYVRLNTLPKSNIVESVRSEPLEKQEVGSPNEAAEANPLNSKSLSNNKSLLSNIDPAAIPEMDIRADEIVVNQNAYGEWAFKLRRDTDALIAEDLTARFKGIAIGVWPTEIEKKISTASSSRQNTLGNVSNIRDSAAIRPSSSRLKWFYGEKPRTEFTGTIHASDLSEVSKKWQQSAMLTSQMVNISVDASWNDYPDFLKPEKLNGVVDVDVQRGRFIKGASAGENPLLKLVGLFNFDTLFRRLRLDFSDLNPEGMAYDAIKGRMYFEESMLYLKEPLVVKTPSSDIHFSGDIDLKAQQLDAQLDATLPLTGNLTLAAAAVGGLPAAIGVYVVGKMFKKQVDQFSTFRYNITGEWSDPKVKLADVSGAGEADAVSD